MQGTINVESKVGKGTKITVTLPHKITQEKDVNAIIEKKKHMCMMKTVSKVNAFCWRKF